VDNFFRDAIHEALMGRGWEARRQVKRAGQ
jgi:hypothetical protein